MLTIDLSLNTVVGIDFGRTVHSIIDTFKCHYPLAIYFGPHKKLCGIFQLDDTGNL